MGNKRNRVLFALLLLLVAGVVVCTAFNVDNPNEKPPVYADFAGMETCISCHKEICDSQVHTAHFLTSAPSDLQNIKGSFAAGDNQFLFNAFMMAEMDTVNGTAYQTAFASNVAYQSEAFDITIGSGKMGQTYLYWNGNSLYQLPISYFTPKNAWCNSPGYPPNFIKFNRIINDRCMECHGTFAAATTDQQGTYFNKEQMIYGIRCERCHGAAAQHVAYQKEHPADTTGKFILHLAKLTRQQKLDACALCHSGIRKQVQPAFTFWAGDKLEDFLAANYKQDSVSMLDVHGNQFGLLTSSTCFRMSDMDCSSCHNTHHSETENKMLFSQRCENCHSEVKHSFATAGNAALIRSNCIDCHMPRLPSSKIVLQLSAGEQSAPDLVTTHHIAVYPDQTKLFLQTH